MAVSARSREPACRSMVTLTDPGVPNIPSPRCLGALISRVPSAYSTRVCFAACWSCSRSLSLGRTSTAVSSRSLAVSRTSPTGRLSTTETGAGVGKDCMVIPPDEGEVDVRCSGT